MERKDAAYWERKYKEQEGLYVSLMTDLENYRSLVHRLKSEANTLQKYLNYSERSTERLEQSLRATLFEETLYEYYDRFAN
jgi:phytoene dehydrogenase-like protein